MSERFKEISSSVKETFKNDKKLTKEELKLVEKILTKERNEIVKNSQNELEELKEIIIKELEDRLSRGNEKSKKYIRWLLSETKKLQGRAQEKQEEQKTESTDKPQENTGVEPQKTENNSQTKIEDSSKGEETTTKVSETKVEVKTETENKPQTKIEDSSEKTKDEGSQTSEKTVEITTEKTIEVTEIRTEKEANEVTEQINYTEIIRNYQNELKFFDISNTDFYQILKIIPDFGKSLTKYKNLAENDKSSTEAIKNIVKQRIKSIIEKQTNIDTLMKELEEEENRLKSQKRKAN